MGVESLRRKCTKPTLSLPPHKRFGWLRIAQQAIFFLAFAAFQSGLVFAYANETTTAATEEEEESAGLPKWAQIILAIVLICLSAIFAGLTIGIMGLDTLSLEIIAEAGPEPDCSYAKKLLPVRRLGHFSLSTLVLGNMWANVMIAQFCADINPEESGGGGGIGGLIAFVVSSLIILIFGEILPMSVCKSANALKVAAAGVPLLKVFLVLLYPIARPLGWFLDKIVHHDIGQIYDRNELIKLMTLHADRLGGESGMDKEEGNILVGALEFKDKKIEGIMTPISETFCVSEDCKVDRTLLKTLWVDGRSRVPVVRGTAGRPISITDCRLTDEDKQDVVGILYIKDLITYNVPDTTVGQYLKSQQQREVKDVTTADTLPKVLALAQTGVSHLFIVRVPDVGTFSDLPTSSSPTPPSGRVVSSPLKVGRVVGICTIEDVLEALIKSEIYDEYDREDDEEDGQPGIKNAKGERVNFYAFHIPNDAATRGTVSAQPLTSAEKAAVAKYLANAVPAFAFWRPSSLRGLLTEATDEVIMPTPQSEGSEPLKSSTFLSNVPSKNILCKKNEPLNEFILLLTGVADVSFGMDGFSSQIGTMNFIGESVLLDSKPFSPTFTAKVAKSPVRVIRISPALYRAHESKMQATTVGGGGFTSAGSRAPIVSRSTANKLMLAEEPRSLD
eukprot:GILI01008106.1.p1 GENE.GILI01008106.1~~GILI01008106.1.p1  ORF type:complete len:674 (-),score=148.63 GILI01008106.1:332-2353(-)